MGCCPSAPAKAPNWTTTPAFQQPTFMVPGENVDCYMARAGNKDNDQTGGLPEKNKIANVSIVSDCNMVVNTQFALTAGSDRVAAKWFHLDPKTKTPISIGTISLNQSSGLLSGPVDPQHDGKTFDMLIVAAEASAPNPSSTAYDLNDPKVIDSKSYTFVPAKCKPSSDLKFVHPLPKSTMTSGFGPRTHPVTKQVGKPHKGADFAYGGGVTKDVFAACDGTVLFAGVQNGYGNCVTIRHINGSGVHICDTHYAHLASIYVSANQKVAANTPIGKEGNTGIGTGAHLHFEVRLKGTQHTDPVPYIEGKVKIGESPTGDSSVPAPVPTVQQNTNTQLTQAKAQSSTGCPTFHDPGPGEPNPTPPPVTEVIPAAGASDCCPDPRPTNSAERQAYLVKVKAGIDAVLNRHPELNAEDKRFIHTLAQIESRYDPCAKNKTPKNPNGTSATGLYQFLDALAKKYYGLMGVPMTCENRVSIEYATEAMVRFYTSEIVPYYTRWVASGHTTIAGKAIIQTQHSSRYTTLTKACWLYGLIHHDGVGNAVKGIDLQGVAYFQKTAQGLI